MNTENQTKDLLADLVEETTYEEATRTQRFVNYLVDYIIVSIIPYVLKYAFALQLSLLEEVLLSYVMFFGYYLLFEGAAGGRTPGKMITKTRAVMITGEPVTFNKVLMRTLSRLVPFEGFSGFAERPWHDSWTGTRVIQEKK